MFYPILAHCTFDKSPTIPIIVFEIAIVVGTGIAIFFLSKIKDKIVSRFLILAIGVLIFELFTAPMWHNYRLGGWAYLYLDVSWILTIGWTSLILTVTLLVDRLLAEWKAGQRFLTYLGILTVSVTVLEAIVVNLGIRSYAPEVLADMTGIFVFGVPIIEVFYYTPVFTGLVISFYKYWEFALDEEPLIPSKQRKWLRSLLISFIAVFMFEVMIQPMVSNKNFPEWSYLFFDISFLLTGLWVLIIGFSAIIGEKFFLHLPLFYRFLIVLGITGAIALPLESWLIVNGYRVYGESALHSFIGIEMPIAGVPIEIAFAIPCYMALIITFIRYWEIILDNRL
ncbi:MAG: hypothetical protein AAGA60_09825 [Cyanobacteria bacterium P01_E01_bin.42]